MQHSLERGFEDQANLHRKALLRALSRDTLLSAGFQTEEVRFRPDWSYGGSGMGAWQTLPRSLEGAEKRNTAENHQSYDARTLGSEFYRIDITPLSSSSVRVSGTAFEILDLLGKMPEGVVEDVFVADILEKRVDPVLIVQIAGYSYIVHAWDE